MENDVLHGLRLAFELLVMARMLSVTASRRLLPALALFCRTFDEQGGVASCDGEAADEIAHFVGDYGETQPGFTSPRCFDGGVEGQDIGLKRDVFDDLGYFRDFDTGGGNIGHAFHLLVQLQIGLLPGVVNAADQAEGQVGVFCVLLSKTGSDVDN